jgi:hypothetical protein
MLDIILQLLYYYIIKTAGETAKEVIIMGKNKKHLTAIEIIMVATLIFEAVKWLIDRLLGG